MEVLIDCSRRSSLFDDGSEPGILVEASQDLTQELGSSALLGNPSVNWQRSSPASPPQRPFHLTSSLAKSWSVFSGNGLTHDLSHRIAVARKNDGLASTLPLTCRPQIGKRRPKALTRSVHHALEDWTKSANFGSSFGGLRSSTQESRESPILTKSPSVDAAAVCVSPGTSNGSEEPLLPSASPPLQSFVDDGLGRPYFSSPLGSISSSEELFSGQSEILCSDGSVSSDVVGSPDFCGLNELMDFMFDNASTDVPCKESFEIQFPAPPAVVAPCHGSLQHSSVCSSLEEAASFLSPTDIHQKRKDAVAGVDEYHKPVGTTSHGSQDLSKGQSGAGGIQATRLWRGQSGASNGFAHSSSTSPEAVSASLCSPKFRGGTDSFTSRERIWFHSPAHQGPRGIELGAHVVDHSLDGHQEQKHDFEQSPDNLAYGSAKAGCEGYQMHEVTKVCEDTRLQNSGIVSIHDDVVNQLCQIKGFGSNDGVPGGPMPASPQVNTRLESDFDGVRIVHLLIAGADAVATRDMDLASVILVRLKELVSCTGSTMQRVAACFSDGLQCWIQGSSSIDHALKESSRTDILSAFQILHEISPYVKFGHFTANQAILEAVEEAKRVHIVDFEIMEGIQWPSFMQALATRKNGPPELRITALFRPHARQGLATVQETGRRLSEFANSLNLAFTFNQLRVDNEEEFRVSSLKLIRGEALVVNCMLHLPHMPCKTATSVSSFLQGMRKLSPVILTLVEEELGCYSPALSTYFNEALHHYSAMFDSLEACLSSQPVGRMLVERVFLAPRITNAVTFRGGVLPRSEVRADFRRRNWCSLVSTAGFKSLPLSSHNLSQARQLLRLFKEGFKVSENGVRLCLSWHSKALIAASAWN